MVFKNMSFGFFFLLPPVVLFSQNRSGSNLLNLPLVNASLAWPRSVSTMHKTMEDYFYWLQPQEMQTW